MNKNNIKEDNKWWSSHQDRQMNILKDINKNMKDSNTIQNSISSDVRKIQVSTAFIAKVNETSIKYIDSIAKHILKPANEYKNHISSFNSSVISYQKSLNSIAQANQNHAKSTNNTNDKVKNSFGQLISAIGTVIGGMKGIGERANKFSAISNDMIQYSGMSGAAVREFRTSIVNTVKDLNSVTGMLYSPTESYQAIVGLAKTVTSDMEALKEMSRPLLLAQETMTVEMGSIAEIFNKFYIRYNFSSLHMEESLESIRSNTAGNSANAAATLENINSLKEWINYTAREDNDLRQELLSTVSQYTSWLESMGLDSTPITKMLKDIAWGDYTNNPELVNILAHGGYSASQATRDLKAGDYGAVTQALLIGIEELFSKVDGSQSMWAFSRYGIDKELGLEISNLLNSGNYQDLNEFIESISNDVSAEKLAQDKYVSAADKTNHWLEQIYKVTADIQEFLGFGITDILLALNLFRGIGGAGGSGWGTLSPGKWGNQYGHGLRKGGSGVLGFLEKGGYNASGGALAGKSAAAYGGLSIAGIGAGVALGADGVIGMLDENKSTGSRVASGVEAAAGITAAGALTASLLGAGAAAGPVGWIALAVAGTALITKKAIDVLTPVSGAANKIVAELEASKNALIEEQANRASQIEALKQSILAEEDQAKALEKARKSGLIPLDKSINYTKDQLLELADAAKKSAYEVGDKAALAYDTMKTVLETAAKKETEEITKSLYEKVFSQMSTKGNVTALRLEGNESLYAQTQNAFLQMAEAIEDEEQREKTVKQVKKYFDDGLLREAELKKLTDQGGLFGRGKSAASRYEQDLATVNAALSGLGVKNYESISLLDTVNKLMESYQSWGNAVDNKSKKTYIEEFKNIWKEIPNNYQDMLRPSLQDIAHSMGILEFAVGTNYITKDQLALVHEGEAIIPKKYNPAANSEEFKLLAHTMQKSQQESKEESTHATEQYNSFVQELREIKEFLSEWKKDNNLRDTANVIRSRNAAGRQYLQQYLST